jgi:DNA-binding NtrC family response regulator
MTASRILLVDDEIPLINVVNHWLENACYETTTCYSADEAADKILNNEYDVLFSDVIMPGNLNGFILAELAIKEQPKIKILLASGYTDGLENNTKFDFEILSKPYRKQYLLDKIKKLFEKS